MLLRKPFKTLGLESAFHFIDRRKLTKLPNLIIIDMHAFKFTSVPTYIVNNIVESQHRTSIFHHLRPAKHN
jgi:hypothetical protein